MIINDILTLKKQKAPLKKIQDERVLEVIRDKEAFSRVVQHLLRGEHLDADSPIVTAGVRLQEKWDSTRLSQFAENNGVLPEAFQETMVVKVPEEDRHYGRNRRPSFTFTRQDGLTMASETPKVDLKELRRIADALKFVIIPLAYLAPSARTIAPSYIGEGLNVFNERLHRQFDLYVLCPPSMYSLLAHVKAEEDGRIYTDPTNTVFGSLRMSIPMFRALWRELEDLKDRVDNIEKRLGRVEEDVASMQRQIEEIQAQLAEQQRQAAIARVANAKRNAALQGQLSALEARAFMVNDPLAFGLLKDTNLQQDDTWAVLGPCWGEDFEDVVFTSLGLKQVEGQRTRLHEDNPFMLHPPTYDPSYHDSYHDDARRAAALRRSEY